MLFLINEKQKNKILDEYYSHLINIISISLLALFIILIVSLFPVYLTMKVDKHLLLSKIEPLKTDIERYTAESRLNNASGIDSDISLLSSSVTSNTLDIYKEIKSIYKEIPNVEFASINIDTLNKKVVVNVIIDNKNTANIIVDRLNNSRYKGAELPYSVFSQNKNFIFNQSLTYE